MKFYSPSPLAMASGLFGYWPLPLLACGLHGFFFFLAENRIKCYYDTHRKLYKKVHSDTTFLWYSSTDLNGVISSAKEAKTCIALHH